MGPDLVLGHAHQPCDDGHLLLRISRNTAKVHLQSIFRKTGTNRQSELVHLLSNVARG